jgi:hypothetical protein
MTLLRQPIHAGAVLLTLLLGIFSTGLIGLAPEPDPIPRRWQLSLEPGPLRFITLDVPGIGARDYFYFTYKVTNGTGQDVIFAPSFDLASDAGDIRRSGRDVPGVAIKALLAKLENPELQDQVSVVGVLLQGEENAREGLVMWPAGALNATDLSVFAAGFSGETRNVDSHDAKTGTTRKVTLRKQLMIRYDTPGEIRGQGASPFVERERRWVLR